MPFHCLPPTHGSPADDFTVSLPTRWLQLLIIFTGFCYFTLCYRAELWHGSESDSTLLWESWMSTAVADLQSVFYSFHPVFLPSFLNGLRLRFSLAVAWPLSLQFERPEKLQTDGERAWCWVVWVTPATATCTVLLLLLTPWCFHIQTVPFTAILTLLFQVRKCLFFFFIFKAAECHASSSTECSWL